MPCDQTNNEVDNASNKGKTKAMGQASAEHVPSYENKLFVLSTPSNCRLLASATGLAGTQWASTKPTLTSVPTVDSFAL